MNNRVKLGELEKRIKYVSFSHFKVNSQEVSFELSRLENLKSCFDIKGRDRWTIPIFEDVLVRERRIDWIYGPMTLDERYNG